MSTKKKVHLASRQGLMWRWLLAACGVMLCWSSAAMAQNIVFTGDAKDKVYGGSLCASNTAINVSWVFTPQSQFTLGTQVTFKVIIGAETEDAGTKIKTYTVTPQASSATAPSGSAEARLESTTSGVSKSASKGMFADPQYLTIRDLIGFSKVEADPNAAPTADNVCNLAAASDDAGNTVVRFCVRAEYNIQETQAGGGVQNVSKDHTQCLDIQFDLTPPKAPTGLSLAPSEKQVIATWTFLQDHKYDFFVSRQAFSASNQKDIVPTPINGNTQVLSSPYTISNLVEQTSYYIAVRATDAAGNQGTISEVLTSSTVELTDFYEAYRKAGGADKGFNGGFCFIATAAYGTYDHSYVKILRDFRDQHLLTNGPGKAFVAWYYRNSPAWADWIRAHPNVKKAVQVLLFPAIVGAAFFVRLPMTGRIFLVLLLLLLVLAIRYRKRKHLQMIAPAALLVFAWGYQAAEAATPRNFGLEVRAGIFQPQIDNESTLNGKPYNSVFGDPLQPFFELNMEWLVFKKYGSIGIGGSVGFTWAAGQSLSAAGTGGNSGDGEEANSNGTGLWIIPLRLDISYRMDYFAINHGFPIVPYVRTGLDYNIWFVTDPSGAIAKDSNQADANSALGGRFGFHVGLGVQFLLDIFDRRAALTFDNEVGVNHTYLFFEWNFSWVGILTPGLNLSDSSFRAGLLFQF